MLDEVYRLTNLERTTVGLPILNRNLKLDNAADAHSENMGIYNIYSHTGYDGSTIWERIAKTGYTTDYAVGENIYKRSFTGNSLLSAKVIVSGWMNSPGHKANILNPNYNQIGLGYFYDDDDALTYWTQNFAKGENTPPPTSPTYTLTPSTSSINEGSALTTTVNTTNVSSGTTLYYSLIGTGINTSDFSSGSLTG